ncbi:hypothetical protein EAG_05329 [Camponotus floridanus]|uniref:Uncharacterized protein n=1 Tax=Camponotus floridanus TaxID=104421 RepID=E2A070_CAMFO|nr:hypothetical protein EAG_05329 [Camponotus floridanus]
MAWFGDSLSSLSNLKGQITNFTKEVLSDGIVEEIEKMYSGILEIRNKGDKIQRTKDKSGSLLELSRIAFLLLKAY